MTPMLPTLALAVSLCMPGQAPAPTAVVARAGSVVVTADELKREALLAQRVGDMSSVVLSATPDGLASLARTILERKLLAAEAVRRRFDREVGVQVLLQRSRDLVLSDTLVLREQLALDTSETARRTFYDARPELFRTGERRKVRHILVATAEEAAKAHAMVTSGGRDFSAVAGELNTDASRARGGLLGWVSPRAMVQSFDAVVFSLRVGQVSDVVRTGMGYHLVMVEEVDSGSLHPYELAKDRIVDVMKADAVERLKGRLRAAGPFVVDRNAIDALLR